MIYNLYKQRGETPLECIQRFAKSRLGLKGEKMTYLGRLDPMAEGVLLMGSGKDTSQKRREEFFSLDKEYDFTALFGFATDTYDVLGKIMRVEKLNELKEMDLIKISEIYKGERSQEYPKYSSKMIARSRQLFPLPVASQISLQQSPATDELLPKNITIHKMQFHKLDTLNNKELFGRLLMDISKVMGDFRQNQILELWKEMLFKEEEKRFIANFSAHVSSGTYIRSIVNDIGKTLGCGATALSIKRTRVGDFKVEDSLQSF